MVCRHLIIGLDGFDLDVVTDLGARQLPNLHAQMAKGAFAATRSVLPPATLPNWATFLTGVDPGEHGVFDFTTRRGYKIEFTAGSVRQTPTIFSRLDALGLKCACLHFPGTWPPEQLKHGVFISGWDAPVAFEADDSYVWPRALHTQIGERFGPLLFDDVNEFVADDEAWLSALPDALCRRVDHKVQLSQWLMSEQDWDAFAIYFGASDTAAHYLWSLYDDASPRRPAFPARIGTDGLARVYARLDRAVGELLKSAGGDSVELTVVSDHGSGGSSDKVLFINRALAEAGLLQFKTAHAPIARLKSIGLRHIPPVMKQWLFEVGGRVVPNWVESRARFGAIDMRATRAFSDELNYFPAVHLNLAGREPQGTVLPHERERTLKETADALLALRDPWTGDAIVDKVHRREHLFVGPCIDRAPDLLLELHLDGGYSYNLMPSSLSAPDQVWRKLTGEQKLGRKGRSLPGSHRPRGFGVIAGPSVRAVGQIDAHISDMTASIMSRLGHTTSKSEIVPARPQGDTALLSQRLRALGYID